MYQSESLGKESLHLTPQGEKGKSAEQRSLPVVSSTGHLSSRQVKNNLSDELGEPDKPTNWVMGKAKPAKETRSVLSGGLKSLRYSVIWTRKKRGE